MKITNQNFTVEELVEYNPVIELQGYKADEIDDLLDKVIDDYNSFQKYIQILEEKIKTITAENTRLTTNLETKTKVLTTLKNDSETKLIKNENDSNIVNRVFALEKEVHNLTTSLENQIKTITNLLNKIDHN